MRKAMIASPIANYVLCNLPGRFYMDMNDWQLVKIKNNFSIIFETETIIHILVLKGLFYMHPWTVVPNEIVKVVYGW